MRHLRHGKQAQGLSGSAFGGADGHAMTHDDLVAALRAIDDLHDVGNYHPNFHFRSRPFLHFHVGTTGIYADVRLGTADFRPVPASTPQERQELLARVQRHVTRVERTRKQRRH
ncbi:MAG TPA: hypothetical protein VFR41_02795 [Acidimicrobiia bacterium]|nr:hypothetical protein [Acidimicrobiia bacterium]